MAQGTTVKNDRVGTRGSKGVGSIKVKAGPDDSLNEGEFTAYAAVFGNLDSHGDKIIKGAFANSLERWDQSDSVIPLLFGHNFDDPDYNIGWILSAKEDDHGLLVHGKLDLSNPKAAQVYKLLKGRRINQLSFAYDILEGAWIDSKEDGEWYELRELNLIEVSLVTLGANRATEVTGVKALDELLSKAGKSISKKNAELLREAISEAEAIAAASQKVVATLSTMLESVEEDTDDDNAVDEEKSARTSEPVKDEEPSAVKSQPMRSVTVDSLAAELELYASL